jgi:hypothetical protein
LAVVGRQLQTEWQCGTQAIGPQRWRSMIQDHDIPLVTSQSPDHIAVEPRDTLVVEFRNRNAQLKRIAQIKRALT